MDKNIKTINTKSLLYYADQICQKIDLQAEGSVKRILALRKGRLDEAEYIEKMLLEPLDMQIRYLVEKATKL